MANWLKVLLGIILSAGIFVGVMAFVYDIHPLRDNSIYTQREACFEQNRYRVDDRVDCYERFRPREEAIDGQEKWLAAGLGAAAAGLFWLLVYFFYIRPRRRRAESQAE